MTNTCLGDLERQKTKIDCPTKMSSPACPLSTAVSEAVSTSNMAFSVILLRLTSPALATTHFTCFALSMSPVTLEFKPSFLSSCHSLHLTHVIVFLIMTWNLALLSFNPSFLNIYVPNNSFKIHAAK